MPSPFGAGNRILRKRACTQLATAGLPRVSLRDVAWDTSPLRLMTNFTESFPARSGFRPSSCS